MNQSLFNLFCMFCIKGATALLDSYFGHDQSPHILTNVKCYSSGSYNSLLQCSHNVSAAINCGDGAIASVVCVGNNFTNAIVVEFPFVQIQSLVLMVLLN